MNRFIANFVINETNKAYKIAIVIMVIVVISYKFLNRYVLNVPEVIWLFFCIVLIYYSVKYFLLKNKRSKNTRLLTQLPEYLKGGVIVLLFFYAIVYTGFCISSKLYAKDRLKEVVLCEITGIGTTMRNKAIYYKFLERNYSVRQYGKIMSQLAENDEYKNYYLKINVSKGLNGSYILNDWKVIKK